jgi:catechol 2,3-dioxygenase-like lactoylglutathione lyase family enzyme
MASPIRKVDVVGIPSTDRERSRQFYVDTLGLRGNPLTLHKRYAPYV